MKYTCQSFDNFTTGLLSSLVVEFLKIQLLTKSCPSKNHIKFFLYPIVMTVRIKVIEPTEDVYYLQNQIEIFLRDYRFKFGTGYKIHYSTASAGDNLGGISYSAIIEYNDEDNKDDQRSN